MHSGQSHIISVQDSKHFARRKRELQTIAVMIDMYCRRHHRGQRPDQGLCRHCVILFDYAERRLQRCVFGDDKPTCAKCLVHCYSAEKREQVRVVMQWAGPRMLLHHPVLAIRHLLDGRRLAPTLPGKSVPQVELPESVSQTEPKSK